MIEEKAYKVITHVSDNFNERPKDLDIEILVLHYTGMQNAEDALDRMCDHSADVSAHYMIDEDGVVYHLVDESKRAWHAGISCWQGRANINDNSIGVEIVNPGHEWGYREFPEVQMQSVLRLCQDLVEKYNIKPNNIVGHSDIAAGRKTDPGELFNWKWLAENGVGLWPEIGKVKKPEKIICQIGDVGEKVMDVQRRLALYGYYVREDGVFAKKTKATITEFKRHFIPNNINGVWDNLADATLNKLLEMI